MSIYLTRTKAGVLTAGLAGGSDTAFVNQRFNGGSLVGARFEHCTFANVSFLRAEMRDCHFSNCVFEGCYFREAELTECHFPASRFIGCEFPKARIYACGFQYARFDRTVPRFVIMEPNLPGQPNLGRDLCTNLAVEASAVGLEREARRYRLEAIRMHEEALRRGYRWSDDYSRDHYPEFQRVTAFFLVCGSRINGWVWGHGEYVSRLLVTIAVVAFLVGPVLLYAAGSHLHATESIGVGDYVALSVASVLNTAGSAGIRATGIGLAVVLALTGIGLVFLGLFVTYVFRAVTRR